MHIKYFGDSYDIVKQSLIRWLAPFGQWSVHPMFTETTNPTEATAFAAFLDARLLSDAVLSANTNRLSYFGCASTCGNLLLDPDTGLRLESFGGTRAAKYLFADEFIRLIGERPGFLTVVFDQSHPRGSPDESLNRKLDHLSENGVFAFAYKSHACFIVAAQDPALARRAYAHMLRESQLPNCRFILNRDLE